MESSLRSTSNVHEIEPELQPHMDINSDAQYGLTLVKDTTRKRHPNYEGFFFLILILIFFLHFLIFQKRTSHR